MWVGCVAALHEHDTTMAFDSKSFSKWPYSASMDSVEMEIFRSESVRTFDAPNDGCVFAQHMYWLDFSVRRL